MIYNMEKTAACQDAAISKQQYLLDIMPKIFNSQKAGSCMSINHNFAKRAAFVLNLK